jgi:hypothetical protein
MDERKSKPKRLVTWAIAGALLAASALLLSLLPIPHFSTNGHGAWAILWANRLRLIAFLAPLALGLSVSLSAERKFKRGFQNDIWNDAELEPVKELVANPIWNWASLILIVPCFLSVILSKNLAHTGAGGFICMALLPTQTAQRIRQLITPRRKPAGGLIDWHNFKPIRSDHWGDQPVHPSE